ncbi:MAG: radical SAM protein [Alphaproteobacteria bacterium]|nr:radical SAM protein [Alphaproteobacteria bacterium]MCB9791179.1 radical SAM protein [Alphaproteobacteria bacterium]
MSRPPLVRMGLGVLRQRLSGAPRPINVMISLTDRCSRRCDYCAIPDRRSPEPNTVQLLELLTELRRGGVHRVGFWGGEPLIRKDIGELLAHTRDLGLWTSMVSNGDLVPLRRDALTKLDHLLLSLDGRAEAHDRQRGPGSHAKVLDALAVARELGLGAWTLTVLTRHNLQDLPWLVELAEGSGHKAAFQVLHHPEALDDGRGQTLAPSRASLLRALRFLLDARRRGRPVANSRRQLQHLLRWTELGRPPTWMDPASPPCAAGTLFINIDTNGQMAPCSLLVGASGLPNVLDGGYQAALQGLPPPPCNQCVATAFTEYNLLFRLDPGVIADWVRDW